MFEKIKSTYEALFSKFKKLFTIKKATLLDGLESEVTLIKDEVVPVIQSVKSAIEDGRIDSRAFESNQVLKSVRSFLKHDVKSNIKLLDVIISISDNIQEYENKLTLLVNKTFPNTTTDKTVTLRELGVMKILNDIILFRTYCTDLAFMVTAETNPDVTLHKEAIARLKDNAGNFANAIDQLNSKVLEDNLKKIPNVAGVCAVDILATGADAVGDVVGGIGDVIGVFGSGFIGNPIYHIRMWLEDIAYKNNESNKAKKQIIELILIDLRKKANGEYDKDLAKQIQYYENKIYTIEHEIARYESGK